MEQHAVAGDGADGGAAARVGGVRLAERARAEHGVALDDAAGEQHAAVGHVGTGREGHGRVGLAVAAEHVAARAEDDVVADGEQVELDDLELDARPEDALAHVDAEQAQRPRDAEVVLAEHGVDAAERAVLGGELLREPVLEVLPIALGARAEAADDDALHEDDREELEPGRDDVARGDGEQERHEPPRRDEPHRALRPLGDERRRAQLDARELDEHEEEARDVRQRVHEVDEEDARHADEPLLELRGLRERRAHEVAVVLRDGLQRGVVGLEAARERPEDHAVGQRVARPEDAADADARELRHRDGLEDHCARLGREGREDRGVDDDAVADGEQVPLAELRARRDLDVLAHLGTEQAEVPAAPPVVVAEERADAARVDHAGDEPPAQVVVAPQRVHAGLVAADERPLGEDGEAGEHERQDGVRDPDAQQEVQGGARGDHVPRHGQVVLQVVAEVVVRLHEEQHQQRERRGAPQRLEHKRGGRLHHKRHEAGRVARRWRVGVLRLPLWVGRRGGGGHGGGHVGRGELELLVDARRDAAQRARRREHHRGRQADAEAAPDLRAELAHLDRGGAEQDEVVVDGELVAVGRGAHLRVEVEQRLLGGRVVARVRDGEALLQVVQPVLRALGGRLDHDGLDGDRLLRRLARRAKHLVHALALGRLVVHRGDGHALGELDAHQLARRVERHGGAVHEHRRPLGGVKVLRGVLGELVQRDARVAEGGHHHAAHGLLQRRVRRGEAADRLDRRVRGQRRLDLRRDDGLAAAVDRLLRARHHVEVALVVDVAVVARVEPAVDELRAVAALVALHHGRALERDVPDLAARQLGTLGRVDLELRPELPARRAGALQVVVVRRRGDGHALGHAVARHEDAPPAGG